MKTLEQKYEKGHSTSAIYPSFYLVAKDYNLKIKKCIDLWASDWRYLKFMGKGSCWVEYSDVDITYCKEHWINVVKWNLNCDFDFFRDESFDFIFSSHVIEHLESPYLFLRRIRGFWWDNAKLILWYPIEHSMVRWFDPYFSCDWHLYSFSLANIKQLLKETWFSIEKIYYDIPFAWRFKLFKRLQKIVQKLPYSMVYWRWNAIYIVAKKI